MKTAVTNFPKSVFGYDYVKLGGSSAPSIKLENVDETVDETEEFKADNNIKPKGAMVQNVQMDQNYIEQNRPTKPNKPQKQFNTSKQDLIEYDDEKPLNLVVPLPGM